MLLVTVLPNLSSSTALPYYVQHESQTGQGSAGTVVRDFPGWPELNSSLSFCDSQGSL